MVNIQMKKELKLEAMQLYMAVIKHFESTREFPGLKVITVYG